MPLGAALDAAVATKEEVPPPPKLTSVAGYVAPEDRVRVLGPEHKTKALQLHTVPELLEQKLTQRLFVAACAQLGTSRARRRAPSGVASHPHHIHHAKRCCVLVLLAYLPACLPAYLPRR